MTDDQFDQLIVVQKMLLDELKKLNGHLVPKTNKKPVSTPKQGKKTRFGEHKNVLLTEEEFEKLNKDIIGFPELLKEFSDGIAMKDYKYKNHNLAIRKWAKNFTPTGSQSQLHNPFE